MKKFCAILLLSIGGGLTAQTTAIPDYRFEQALVDLGVDSDATVNGQMLTADALNVTSLTLSIETLPNYPYPSTELEDGYIQDVTGIEAFINLESLVINFTMIESIDVSTLVKLNHLNLSNSMLTSIDLTNNPLLENLNIESGGDVFPMNSFFSVDLSNNPLVGTLNAQGISQINLKNHDGSIPITAWISCNFCWVTGPDFIFNNVCIIVDDAEEAQNDVFPYATWTILNGSFVTYNFAETDVQCALSVSDSAKKSIRFYPNPVVSGIIYFENPENLPIRVQVFDHLGRLLMMDENVGSMDVSRLAKGNYFFRFTADGVQVEKVVIR